MTLADRRDRAIFLRTVVVLGRLMCSVDLLASLEGERQW
jgi:hypothetical protein